MKKKVESGDFVEMQLNAKLFCWCTVSENGLHDHQPTAGTGYRRQGEGRHRHGPGGRHATRRLRPEIPLRHRHGRRGENR